MLPLTKLNIKKAKLEDIQKQLKFIPDVYHGFYRNLASAPAGSLEDQTSCSEEEDVEVSAVASAVKVNSLCLLLQFITLFSAYSTNAYFTLNLRNSGGLSSLN